MVGVPTTQDSDQCFERTACYVSGQENKSHLI